MHQQQRWDVADVMAGGSMGGRPIAVGSSAQRTTMARLQRLTTAMAMAMDGDGEPRCLPNNATPLQVPVAIMGVHVTLPTVRVATAPPPPRPPPLAPVPPPLGPSHRRSRARRARGMVLVTFIGCLFSTFASR